MGLPAVVFNTDPRWFHFFRPSDELVLVDEVNSWRPIAQDTFRALHEGEPLFFRLNSPAAAVAGFGFFAAEHRLPIDSAWELFQTKNGDPTSERFGARIRDYRDRVGRSDEKLSCLILRDATFLPSTEWLAWGANQGWSPRVQSYKTYDLADRSAADLRALLTSSHPDPVPDFAESFSLLSEDLRLRAEATEALRVGQGAFRVRLYRAYDGRCAVTGEHALPVLDAAHIQRYLGPASNHIQNGLLLRADLHRLYDGGYLTVTPDLVIKVSSRLRDEWHNGKLYYDLAHRRIGVPSAPHERPSRDALEWHGKHVFR